MNIYLLNNKRIEGQPLNSQILKASTRTSEFPEGIIVKVLYVTENGFPSIRCWIKEYGAYNYPQTLMLENSWQDGQVHWFSTCCSGGFTLDRWHEMLEALKPTGKVLLLEYRLDGETARHIKIDHRMSVKQVKSEWLPAGFELLELEEFLPTQHLFIFGKAKPKE